MVGCNFNYIRYYFVFKSNLILYYKILFMIFIVKHQDFNKIPIGDQCSPKVENL